mmetsp:Transcript_4478/g.6712  ORF Transcript_4478/g.6712 Transcript_4478/m.6712 type:complete len:353 (-) Transcript_4478:23-1081(-)
MLRLVRKKTAQMSQLSDLLARKKRKRKVVKPLSDTASPRKRSRKVFKTRKQLRVEQQAKQAKQQEEKRKTNTNRVQDSSTNKQQASSSTSTVTPIVELALTVEECIRRLRSFGEPARLFGESDLEREARLRHLETLKESGLEFKKGQKNDFAAVLKAIDKLRQQEALLGADTADDEAEKKSQQAKSCDWAAMTPKDNTEKVLFWLKQMLSEWKEEIDAAKHKSTRLNAQDKIQMATYHQTIAYLKPLFKILKNKSIPGELLAPMLEIVEAAKQREYVTANDAYLRMAIGNSPWPIGVTNVGIHERSARSKIFANQIAHVLNDEQQRKYIQSMKRLISFCQRKYPADPSKQVS